MGRVVRDLLPVLRRVLLPIAAELVLGQGIVGAVTPAAWSAGCRSEVGVGSVGDATDSLQHRRGRACGKKGVIR
jgi:hypothetical protein